MSDSFSTGYAWVLERARAKGAAKAALNVLPRTVRAEVWAELLTEEQLTPASEARLSDGATPLSASRLVSEPAQAAREPIPQHAVPAKKDGARRGRPKRRGKRSSTLGRTEKLVAVLRDNPGLSIAALSTQVYGEASADTNSKTRSLLHSLKKQGKVQSRGTGQWELVTA